MRLMLAGRALVVVAALLAGAPAAPAPARRRRPSGWGGLFLWNGTGRAGEPTSVGVSSLVLEDGDAIAWDLAAFDSVTSSWRTPVPNPDDPTPSIGFRNDGVSG